MHLYENVCNLKLLVPQSKFSGTRKFTLRYQLFEMNFDFEISRVDFIRLCQLHTKLAQSDQDLGFFLNI